MPKKNQIVGVVRVVLTAEPDLFLLSRKLNRQYYELGISGTVEQGEAPYQTAIRETKEELDLVPSSLEPLITYRVGSVLEVKAYLGRCTPTSLAISDELAESRWVSSDSALSLIQLPEHFLLLGQVLAKKGVGHFRIDDYREAAPSTVDFSPQAAGRSLCGT